MIRINDLKSYQGFIYQDQYTRRFVFCFYNDETQKWETNGIENFKPNNVKTEYYWSSDPNFIYGQSSIEMCGSKLINEENSSVDEISNVPGNSTIKFGTLEMPPGALSPDQLT